MTKAETKIRRYNHQLLALGSACAAITSSLDMQNVADTAARELVALLEVEACATYIWDQARDSLSLLAHFGANGYWPVAWQTETHRLADAAPVKRVLVERQPLQLPSDLSHLPSGDGGCLQESGAKARLLVPMLSPERVVGLVELKDQAERDFTAEEIALAQMLANQAARAIENARVFNEMRQRVEELTTLNLIGQVFTSSLDLYETLATVTDYAIRLLGGAAASLALYDTGKGDLWFAAASGRGSDFVRHKRLALGTGIVGWTIQCGESALVPDVSQDPRFFSDFDRSSGFTTRSILCVPLQKGDRTIGAIEVINKGGSPFDRDDLRILSALAAPAAIAIENARAYHQNRLPHPYDQLSLWGKGRFAERTM